MSIKQIQQQIPVGKTLEVAGLIFIGPCTAKVRVPEGAEPYLIDTPQPVVPDEKQIQQDVAAQEIAVTERQMPTAVEDLILGCAEIIEELSKCLVLSTDGRREEDSRATSQIHTEREKAKAQSPLCSLSSAAHTAACANQANGSERNGDQASTCEKRGTKYHTGYGGPTEAAFIRSLQLLHVDASSSQTESYSLFLPTRLLYQMSKHAARAIVV